MKKSSLILYVFCLILAVCTNAQAIGFDAEKVYSSIFVVYSGTSLGSGFAIGENCVVTNAHVIEDTSDISLKTYDDQSIDASLAAIDYDRDIAILAVDKNLEVITSGDIDSCSIGDDVYAIGAPKSLSYTLTKGVISAKNREIDGHNYIQIDAAINQGNSGGPLLTNSGEVIGVNSMTFLDSEGISLAIPISEVYSFLVESGFRVGENGTVNIIEIENQEDTVEPLEQEDSKIQNDETELKGNVKIIIYYTLVSVFLVSVLLALIIYKKNKRKVVKADMTDRTDFDIEIQEKSDQGVYGPV